MTAAHPRPADFMPPDRCPRPSPPSGLGQRPERLLVRRRPLPRLLPVQPGRPGARAAIHWGHVSSTDLVRWRPEPIALVNRPGELDEFGCWTGCVVDDDGVPTAVYSAVADARPAAPRSLLARSDRTCAPGQQGRKSVASHTGRPGRSRDVRDPFVFEVGGHRYAVQGAGHRRAPAGSSSTAATTSPPGPTSARC